MAQAPRSRRPSTWRWPRSRRISARGSVMRLGEEVASPSRSSPPDPSPWTWRWASGSAARPRRRDLRPGILGQTIGRAASRWPTRRPPVASRRSSTPSTRWIPSTPSRSVWTPTRCWCPQPDAGSRLLEIADMLIRSGALDILVIDSVAALVPRAEIEGDGRQPCRPAGPADEPGAAENDRRTEQFQAPPRSSSTSCARRSESCSGAFLRHPGPAGRRQHREDPARSSTRRWTLRCCPTTP